MWSFSNAINFLIRSPKKFSKIMNGITAYSKDTLSELQELFSRSGGVDMNSGIEDILYGNALGWWGNIFASMIIACFDGIFSAIGNIIGICIGLLIASLILQIMYNHKDAWNPLFLKLYCIFVIFEIVLDLIFLPGAILSFSLSGIISVVRDIVSILASSLVLKGLLE